MVGVNIPVSKVKVACKQFNLNGDSKVKRLICVKYFKCGRMLSNLGGTAESPRPITVRIGEFYYEKE